VCSLCSFLLQVLVDDVHEAAPDGPLAIHPLCHLAEFLISNLPHL
jgi:hypothetical protein